MWRWLGRSAGHRTTTGDPICRTFSWRPRRSRTRMPGKRIIGADKPMQEAGIDARDGLAEVAGQMRRIVTRPMVKGEVSTRLTATLGEPYLRYCVPCQAVHPWEQTFRLSALYGGLELQPGTSPPILRRVPGWPRRPAGRRTTRSPHRSTCNRSATICASSDRRRRTTSPLSWTRRWPRSRRTGPRTPSRSRSRERGSGGSTRRSWKILIRTGCGCWAATTSYLQAKDRALVLPDKSRHKALWPVIGRPGAVLSGVEIIGTWRPKATRLDLHPAARAVGQGEQGGPQSDRGGSRAARRPSRPHSGLHRLTCQTLPAPERPEDLTSRRFRAGVPRRRRPGTCPGRKPRQTGCRRRPGPVISP